MNKLLKEIEENIAGLWVNERYELILGMGPEHLFSLLDKSKDPATGKDGKYIIVEHNENHVPILRLTWMNQSTMRERDYIIKEVIAFENLTITHDGVEIRFTNRAE